MKNNEIWKDIEGYEGHYQVSDKGRVKSVKFGKERILKPVITTKKYLQVHLCKNNIRKDYHIHRLVAQAYIPNPNNLPHINHKNEDRTDNRVENLEWCDAKYNNNYGNHNKKISEKLSKSVDQFSIEGKFIKTWSSMHQVTRELGITVGQISLCCRKKQKKAGNFIWKYHIDV